jgi:hypothetical protein
MVGALNVANKSVLNACLSLFPQLPEHIGDYTVYLHNPSRLCLGSIKIKLTIKTIDLLLLDPT